MKKLTLAILVCMLMALSSFVVACEHQHKYSKEWSSDQNYHWHETTCEHKGLISGKAEHSFGEDGKCSVCNRAKEDIHEHTYSEEWSKDATHHWHAATCQHSDLVKDKAEHSFDDSGKCNECDYQQDLPSAMEEVAGRYYQWVFDGTQEDFVIDFNTYIELNSDGAGKIVSNDYKSGGEGTITYILDGNKINLTSAITDENRIVEFNGYINDGVLDFDTDVFYIKEDIDPFKKYDNIIYGIGNDGGYCVVRAANKDITSATIKSEIDGESVTSIRVNAFNGCANLKSIVIPGSISSIGDSAFRACESLEGAVILNGVTSIGNSAFRDCSSLSSIIIANGVTSIGDYAFYECSSLSSIIIPNSVTSIGDYVFYVCSSLESIRIPNGVTSIGDYAFYWCENLSSVTIPDSVTSIGDYAFQLCGKLESIVIPKSVTSVGQGAFGGFWFLGGLKTVYYKGSAEEWAEINIGVDNNDLTSATRYYYSEQEPSADDKYNDFWHYVNGDPTVWGKEE